mgnify:CR=1 FL=1
MCPLVQKMTILGNSDAAFSTKHTAGISLHFFSNFCTREHILTFCAKFNFWIEKFYLLLIKAIKIQSEIRKNYFLHKNYRGSPLCNFYIKQHPFSDDMGLFSPKSHIRGSIRYRNPQILESYVFCG